MAVKVNDAKCTGCGICVDVCPVDAIKIENDKARIEDTCIDCNSCVDQCPNGALSAAD